MPIADDADMRGVLPPLFVVGLAVAVATVAAPHLFLYKQMLVWDLSQSRDKHRVAWPHKRVGDDTLYITPSSQCIELIAPGGQRHRFEGVTGFVHRESNSDSLRIIVLRFRAESFDAACRRAITLMNEWALDGGRSLVAWKSWIHTQRLEIMHSADRDWSFEAAGAFPICRVQIRWNHLGDQWVVEWHAVLRPGASPTARTWETAAVK